jgi:hypothetical protein
MARNCKSQHTTSNFSVVTGVELDWDDHETKSDVSYDSEEDFFENWDAELDCIIAQRTERFAHELVHKVVQETKQYSQLLDQQIEAKKTPTQTLFDRLAKLDADLGKLSNSNKELRDPVEQIKEETPEPIKEEIPEPIQEEAPKTKISFHKYWKFPVRQNGKEPARKRKDPMNQTKAPISTMKFNSGVPTGSPKNLLVVDVETTIGGYQYYFKHTHTDVDCEALIRYCLRDTTKFRGKGLDIRSEGAYVVAPPSVRDGLTYDIINYHKPIDIPSALISWLWEGRGAIKSEPHTVKQVTTITTTQQQAEPYFDCDLSEAVATDI